MSDEQAVGDQVSAVSSPNKGLPDFLLKADC